MLANEALESVLPHGANRPGGIQWLGAFRVRRCLAPCPRRRSRADRRIGGIAGRICEVRIWLAARNLTTPAKDLSDMGYGCLLVTKKHDLLGLSHLATSASVTSKVTAN